MNSYNLVTPIKLDQNNFIVWRTQVLTSIKGNGLEGFITRENKCPDQYLYQNTGATGSSNDGSGSRIDNLAFSAWIRTYQILLSWMMSSIQESFIFSHSLCFITRAGRLINSYVCFPNSGSNYAN